MHENDNSGIEKIVNNLEILIKDGLQSVGNHLIRPEEYSKIKENWFKNILALQVFLFLSTLVEIYSSNPRGPRISKLFLLRISSTYIENGIFKNTEDWNEFIEERLKKYQSVADENRDKDLGELWYVVKEFYYYIEREIDPNHLTILTDLLMRKKMIKNEIFEIEKKS